MHIMAVAARLKHKSFNLALMRQCCQEIEECMEISHSQRSFLVVAHKESCNVCFK